MKKRRRAGLVTHQYKKLPVTMKMWMQFNVMPRIEPGPPAHMSEQRTGIAVWYNTLASDANGPDSTTGGTLELDDTGYHSFVDRRNM